MWGCMYRCIYVLLTYFHVHECMEIFIFLKASSFLTGVIKIIKYIMACTYESIYMYVWLVVFIIVCL